MVCTYEDAYVYTSLHTKLLIVIANITSVGQADVTVML